jgi:hypothetical protein
MNITRGSFLGAIAGYVAGMLVKGDEGLGVIGHIVLASSAPSSAASSPSALRRQGPHPGCA